MSSLRFLVATDGSEESDDALSRAIEFASTAGAHLTIVHAVTPRIHAEGTEPIRSLSDAERRLILEDVEDAEQRGEAILEAAARRAEDTDVEVETALLYGEPVESIVEYAAEEEFDGIYVGHRGLSDRAESYLGSVANGLVRRSSVPVTVVR